MQSGLAIARWLETQQPRSRASFIRHFQSHPGHAIWKRDFTGATGLFTAVLKPVSEKALAAFLDGLKLFGMGYSWGGYESLVIPFDPRSLSHGDEHGATPARRCASTSASRTSRT